MKKSLPIFLIASLCLNAALIGGIAAGVWKLASDQRDMPRREAHGERPHGPIEERIARTAMRELSREERMELRQRFAEEWRNTRGEREEIETTRQTLLELISAETFDRSAVESAFDDIRALEGGFRDRMHSGLIDLLEEMPVEKRRRLIETVRQQQEEWKRERRSKSDKAGPGEGRDGPPPPPLEEDGPQPE